MRDAIKTKKRLNICLLANNLLDSNMRVSFFLLVFLSLFSLGAMAQETAHEEQDGQSGATGLPLPRFVSLNVKEANLRTGPGTRYPIEWVYVREGLPLEITAESEVWRRVRDWDGSEGWVHKNALSSKRTAIITHEKTVLHKADDPNSPAVATVGTGSIGRLLSCAALWCAIRFDSVKGYVPKQALWGVYAQEVFD